MHIGFNLVFLTPGDQGGLETYVRELIPPIVAAAPQHTFTAFVSRDGAEAQLPWLQGVTTTTVPVRPGNRVEWVRGEQQLLPALARRAGVDLLHSTANTAPAWGAFARVVTIHDMIFRTVGEIRPGLREYGMRVLVPLAARRSDRIIAISEATRHDILRYTSASDARVDVVPNGPGTVQRATPTPEGDLRRRLGAGDRRVVLSVSAKLRHKNLMRLINAFATIPAEGRPLLVLPGYATPYEAELRRRTEELGVTDHTRFLGWISEEDLEGLYALASCVVLPSLAEGWGSPVLESLSRGVPLACSSGGAYDETAGDAAIKFDPTRESEIATAIQRILGDPGLAAQLRSAGPLRAATFSWERTATGTIQTYERVLAGRSARV